MDSVVDYVQNNPDKYIQNIENKIYDNGICLEILSDNISKVYNSMSKGCILRNQNNKNIMQIKNNMLLSDEKLFKLNLVDPEYDKKSLLYGLRLDDSSYVFLYTTLENIESTSQILQGQLKYITLFVMTVSGFIAYYFSKTITKPIIKITNKAKDLAKGNLDVKFDKSNIRELDELSDTLNQTIKELKITDELRRDLMANISHDLKTPLTMIKAYAEMVKDISCDFPDKRETHLDIIINETERLNNLVNDILELSKIQSNNQQLEISEFNLVDEINSIIKSYSIMKEVLDYKFILDLPEVCLIKGDKQKINRAIYNLINNAINYTGKDNKVYVTVKNDKKNITISIKDTGKGISKEDLDNIWNRYYKNDKNHKRNVIGTGLGLAIVREIFEAHKFKYGVNTKKNEGSEFYFIINK